MKLWRAALLIVFTAALVTGCALPRSPDHGFRSGFYTVRTNDTLYSIAWRYGLDWQHLARWNGIAAPYTIRPGQRLRMNPPPGGGAVASSPPPASPRSGTSQGASTGTTPGAATRPAPPSTRSTPPPSSRPAPPRAAPPSAPPPAAAVTDIQWRWPADGQVIRPFPTGDTGKRGIGISGTRGQPVRAAAPGRVVYSGSGLVGYGQLIIVKHNERFLSAYAHNERLLVNEGMDVAGGQQIAQLGDTGTDRPMLHFEIRHDGRPVDPLRYLPKR